ncbi:MAG: holo-ACP synthase [candidate division Zixibacteria bacterium]|nr:holo-ACP synthase [candidate division Zixibacteria bacterium]
MVESIGIDIAEVARFERLVRRHGDRLVRRILGQRETETYLNRHDRAAFLAGRFAAKEAVVKALGKFLTTRPPLSELEIINDPSGQPRVKLPDRVAAHLCHVDIQVSISHEKSFAIGLAICTEKS